MWLTILFGLIVSGSLSVSTLLYFDLVEASPEFLGTVGGLHVLFGWVFFRGYLGYRSVHRLVDEGRGELFDLAISHRIHRERFRTMRDIFRLRRIEGLALTGLGREALEAAAEFRREAKPSSWMAVEALAAEAEANVLLGATFWAERVLGEAAERKGGKDHPEVRAVRGRLAFQKGDPEAAAAELGTVLRSGYFPLTSTIRARNRFWYAEALQALGRSEEARRHFRSAARLAPRSFWGRKARRLAGGARGAV